MELQTTTQPTFLKLPVADMESDFEIKALNYLLIKASLHGKVCDSRTYLSMRFQNTQFCDQNFIKHAGESIPNTDALQSIKSELNGFYSQLHEKKRTIWGWRPKPGGFFYQERQLNADLVRSGLWAKMNPEEQSNYLKLIVWSGWNNTMALPNSFQVVGPCRGAERFVSRHKANGYDFNYFIIAPAIGDAEFLKTYSEIILPLIKYGLVDAESVENGILVMVHITPKQFINAGKVVYEPDFEPQQKD